MAIVAGIKIKTKQFKPRNPLFADEKYTGGEPEWPVDAIEWDDAKFDNRLRQSFYYYNYYYNQKDTKKHVIELLKSLPKLFTTEQVRTIEKATDKWMPMTACSIVMAHRNGMPLKQNHLDFLVKIVIEVCNRFNTEPIADIIASSEQVAARPTIQDRLAEKTSEVLGEIEGFYDELLTTKKSQFKTYEFLTSSKVPQAQLSKYTEFFAKRRAELEAAQQKQDPQLVEAYKNFKAADFKIIFDWMDRFQAGIDQYSIVKKATKKAKIKKAPSKEKVVASIKYAKENKALKVVSINPADIIGASTLWVYNVTTRKLGKYVAASYQTLSVKGTCIIGFDLDKSVAKTLRKPEEQLKDFAKAGKVALRTWLKDIKSVEIKLNGRINADTILLKVE
jgi:hypothetical protein